MYKLLIVDDEMRIRTGLSNLIEWEVYGIEVAGLAEDGMKAYIQIKSIHPDIVLVDISMPNITGLEQIELCSHLEHPPKFIILSGYDDFEYVRRAIQLGASDYLLKPIDENELILAISSCVEKLETDLTYQKQFQESIQTLRNDVLMRVLHNQIDSRELHEKSQIVDISLYCISMRVGVLMLRPSEKNNLLLMQAVEICREICSSLCQCYVVSDVNTNIAVIFKDPEQQFTDTDYLDTLQKCSEKIAALHDLHSYIALGHDVRHINELSTSYTDCISKLEKKLILGDIIEDKLSKSIQPAVDYQAFLKCIETRDSEQIKGTLQNCCQRFLMTKEDEDINYIKYQLIDLVTYVLRSEYPNSYFSPELERKKQQVFAIIEQTGSILQLIEKLTVFFISLSDMTADLSEEAGYSHIIQHVLSIIRRNYSDNSLSLKTIAGQLNVNPAYLGREFTLATGEYFNDFLNHTRITKACQLLETTTQKTSQIAETVGFANSSYFFTVFKKNTGQSPRDYRAARGKI